MVALKRASRRLPEIANTMAAIQPPLLSSWSCQKYRIRPGATPKLTKSARLSSSAPNLDCPLIMRATRPSMPSSTAANTIAAIASSIRPSVDSRIAVRPAQIASRVMTLGTSIRTGIGRNRRRRSSGYLDSYGVSMASQYSNRHLFPPLRRNVNPDRGTDGLIGPVCASWVARAEIGQNRLPGDRGLALADQRLGPLGKKHVEPRSEPDEAK